MDWMILKFDTAEQYQLGFQDPASTVMEEIVNFHNYVMIYLVFVTLAVCWIFVDILYSYSSSKKLISHKYLVHGTWLEIVWTLAPAVILIFIAFPSFKLIYLMDEVIDAGVTIKAIGHQWYWSYEYSDYALDRENRTAKYDSYMVPEDELGEGELRLLEVDNRVLVPTHTNIRVIVTAADVLHCWAVPSLGVKIDAVPGRLNQTSFLATREGLFMGQCSEICGANHAFMPITILAVDMDTYIKFIGTEYWMLDVKKLQDTVPRHIIWAKAMEQAYGEVKKERLAKIAAQAVTN